MPRVRRRFARCQDFTPLVHSGFLRIQVAGASRVGPLDRFHPGPPRDALRLPALEEEETKWSLLLSSLRWVGTPFFNPGPIEQPEIHIHPALQVALGDLFISRSRESQVCFLLETHSEHLMLRFLRRIRETDEGNLPPGKDPLRPDQLAVYYVEQGETGVSVFPIRISEDGEFVDRWPKGFFKERADELF